MLGGRRGPRKGQSQAVQGVVRGHVGVRHEPCVRQSGVMCGVVLAIEVCLRIETLMRELQPILCSVLTILCSFQTDLQTITAEKKLATAEEVPQKTNQPVQDACSRVYHCCSAVVCVSSSSRVS